MSTQLSIYVFISIAVVKHSPKIESKVKSKSNTLFSLRYLSVQEEVSMKYIHTIDGRQVNCHTTYSTYNNQVDLSHIHSGKLTQCLHYI